MSTEEEDSNRSHQKVETSHPDEPGADMLSSSNPEADQEIEKESEEEKEGHFALQSIGIMFQQHAEIMRQHADQIQNMLTNPDEVTWSWGCSDHNSYQSQEYGEENLNDLKANDPLVETTELRKNLKQIRREIHHKRKNIEITDDIFNESTRTKKKQKLL